MQFSSRIEVIEMNGVPRLLYVFQGLLEMIPKIQFRAWDRMILRFIWEEKKKSNKTTLQLAKDKG